MKTSEISKQIRTELKSLGIKNFSVRSGFGGYDSSVRVEAKSETTLMQLQQVEKVAMRDQSVDRCESTGEILSGGNTYITVVNHLGRSARWSMQTTI